MKQFFMFMSLLILITGYEVSWADETIKPNRFMFVLKASSATLNVIPNENPNKIKLLRLNGLAGKTEYFSYAPDHQGGYVDTTSLLTAMQQWSREVKLPLLVVIKSNSKNIAAGLIATKPMSSDSWELFYVQPSDEFFKTRQLPPAMMNEGEHDNIIIESDLLPININSLPRSICSPTMKVEECMQLPLLKDQ